MRVANTGPGSPPSIAVANSVNDLAVVLQGLGDLESALRAFQEALEIKEALRGPAHREFRATKTAIVLSLSLSRSLSLFFLIFTYCSVELFQGLSRRVWF